MKNTVSMEKHEGCIKCSSVRTRPRKRELLAFFRLINKSTVSACSERIRFELQIDRVIG